MLEAIRTVPCGARKAMLSVPGLDSRTPSMPVLFLPFESGHEFLHVNPKINFPSLKMMNT